MEDTFSAKIRARMQRMQDEIAAAAVRTGREAQAVRLVVVTKAQPLEVVRSAIDAGARLLGENYAEEAAGKISALKEKTEVEWHMIGHVQSRKAELVAGHFGMLQSLDSLRLAQRLDRFCSQQNKRLPVLLEINVSGEASKFGFQAWQEDRWAELLPDVGQIAELPHLAIRGLMTMPPYFDDPVKSRPFFRRLSRLKEYLARQIPQAGWGELSMGTSADYMVAVEEGATFVRIGQAILGPRPK